jgi:hypothetical protein
MEEELGYSIMDELIKREREAGEPMGHSLRFCHNCDWRGIASIPHSELKQKPPAWKPVCPQCGGPTEPMAKVERI